MPKKSPVLGTRSISASLSPSHAGMFSQQVDAATMKEPSKGLLIVEVQDSGIGIEAHQIDNLF
jgi:signal transduction histidine kinase